MKQSQQELGSGGFGQNVRPGRGNYKVIKCTNIDWDSLEWWRMLTWEQWPVMDVGVASCCGHSWCPLWSSWCHPPESPLMPPSKLLMPPSSHQQHLQFGCHRKQLFFHYQSNSPHPLFHQIDVLFFGCMVWAHSMWAYGGMLWLLGPWLEVPSLVRWGYQAAMRDGPFLIIFQFMIIDHHNHPWHSSIGRQVDDNVWV